MPENSAPFEIIAAPFTAWLAPIGTAFPAIQAEPAATWLKLGKSGDKNISEDGVSVTHPQSLEFFRTLGSTLPRKAVRTEEDVMISFTLLDLTLEMYRKVLNDNGLSEVVAASGIAGVKKLSLARGRIVTQHALLLRGPSAYGENWTAQYKIPIVVHVGEPELSFTKGEPAGLLFEFQAIESDTLPELEMQNAEALA